MTEILTHLLTPALCRDRSRSRPLFLALEGVADQPDQGWPQADEEGPAFGVAALVLVDRLGADPQRDAERHGTE